MDIRKHGERIESLDDWFRFAPPKQREKHWRDGRSAKELARFWLSQPDQGGGNTLLVLLRPCFGQVELISAEPERQVRIDDYRGEHRNCDLKITAEAAAGKLCIHIEAKADEPFGDCLIGPYYDKNIGTKSNIPNRIRNLTKDVFGPALRPEVRALRYQLLHGTFAAVSDAVRSGANIAIFVVHEFKSSSLNQARLTANQADWERFLVALGLDTEERRTCSLRGPVFLHSNPVVPLYLGKVTTEIVLR